MWYGGTGQISARAKEAVVEELTGEIGVIDVVYGGADVDGYACVCSIDDWVEVVGKVVEKIAESHAVD